MAATMSYPNQTYSTEPQPFPPGAEPDEQQQQQQAYPSQPYVPQYEEQTQDSVSAAQQYEQISQQVQTEAHDLDTHALPYKRGAENGGEKKFAGWPGENVFRLIVPVSKVGVIIGRKGEFVKKMVEETKARIKILEGVLGTMERVVMVSAKEDPDAVLSPAMDALLKVHLKVVEGVDGDVVATTTSRLLAPATQAGSLIGKHGATIKALQETSGATVRILPPEDLPLYALPDDRVVEITGEPRKVIRAMELVISHFRKFLVDRSVLPLFEYNISKQNSGVSQEGYPQAAPVSAYATPTEYAMYGKDPKMMTPGAQPPQAIVTQVTQHMKIPLAYVDVIIGSSGANVAYVRRTSGANINVQEVAGASGEIMVEISGTSPQVQHAEQLIQGFLQHYSSYAQQQQRAQYPGAAPNTGAYSTNATGAYTANTTGGYTTASNTGAYNYNTGTTAGGYTTASNPGYTTGSNPTGYTTASNPTGGYTTASNAYTQPSNTAYTQASNTAYTQASTAPPGTYNQASTAPPGTYNQASTAPPGTYTQASTAAPGTYSTQPSAYNTGSNTATYGSSTPQNASAYGSHWPPHMSDYGGKE